MCVACPESDDGNGTMTHLDFQRRSRDFKKMAFRNQTAEAKKQVAALMRLSCSCAESDSRTVTSFRSVLKHGGVKNRNYVVMYQRLLHFWWQKNGGDRLRVDAICEQNVQSTRQTEEGPGGRVHLIKKRPGRPKFPSKRKHVNIPCAASDSCLSYIGRHRSLIYLLVDLALTFDAAVPWTR